MIINYVDILYKKIKKLEEQNERLNNRVNQLSEENEELLEENKILDEMYNEKINDCNRLEYEKQHLINVIESQKTIFKKFLNGDLE